jgi:hypothetical protein
MVAFAKLAEERQRPRFDWVYKCDRCKEETAYVCEMPPHMREHRHDALRWPRCFGRQWLVRIEPADAALERCRDCYGVGRRDPVKGPAWIDPACTTCGGVGAVPRVPKETA